MKKTVLIISAISALVPILMVLGFYYNNYLLRTDASSSSNITSLRNMGLASFNLDKTSSVRTTFSLNPSLSNQPIPTNKWWENAVSADPWPQPLYNLPLSSSLNEKGLGVGLPTVSATADNISATAVSDVLLTPDTAASHTAVRSFDDLSVTINALGSNNETVYSTTLVKGVPFVYSDFETSLTIDTGKFSHVTINKLTDTRYVLRFTVGDKPYAVYAPSSSEMKKTENNVHIKKTKNVIIASLPIDASESLRSMYDGAAAAIVIGTQVHHAASDLDATTTLTYKTENGQNTIVATLPHQSKAPSNAARPNTIGEMDTVRGVARLIRSNTVSYTTSIPSNTLSLSLPPDSASFTKSKLEDYLKSDLSVTVNGLSYDGSKELFRLANLTMIAHESNSPTAPVFKEKLKTELIDWLSYEKGEANKYFYYDKKIKGLVAAEPQYGSEHFNDHHFHYGYFLYAAAVLGTYDKDFVKNYGDAISFVGEDIASEGTRLFPRYRTYDAYEGHSWAGGLSPFADGNNQESISEAVHAWYALYSWAKVSDNKEQKDTAAWLYSNEAAAALTYYYKNPSNPFPEGYGHDQASLLWGGKTDWTTWFSALPEAKHAIIMLPLSGGSSYLRGNDAIKHSIAELDETLGDRPRSAYQDILLLGQSLQDSSGARSLFSDALPIDNSNSRSYVYYYLAWAEQQ